MCAGISLYGVASSSGDETRLHLDLRPVLALKAKVVLIRDVPKGEFVGYGRAYQTPMDSRIAILPTGYADGLPINLSGAEASVEIGGYQPSSFVRSRKAIQIPRNRELDYPDGGVVYFRSSCFSICTLTTYRVFFHFSWLMGDRMTVSAFSPAFFAWVSLIPVDAAVKSNTLITELP